ncbi:MAG: TIGR02453 family protein [Acidobacteria bacterium]|nr:TIGR02453 family protein [Acidobacteriota bacterium]
MPKDIRFSPQLFTFLEELKANNNRDWFEANRHRYLEFVKEPMLAFIAAFRPRLANFSNYLIADPKPHGGSMLRLHRDLRFSKSKEPYKAMAAAYFWHQSGKESRPGIYLHLDPEHSFLGVGLWRPATPMRRDITDAIADKPDAWKAAVTDRQFKSKFKFGGESLAKLPKQYSPDHPFSEDLRRKDFIVTAEFTPTQVCAKDFLDRVENLCEAAKPFMQFLTKAAGLKW